jgi:cell division septum initiation protein DivIVA
MEGRINVAHGFSYVKKGYDPAQVDKHIGLLEAELKEYREKDTAISGAILNAQVAADEIMRKANVASETIQQNARNISSRLNEKSSDQINLIIAAVREQRTRLREFKDDYNALVAKYILTIDDNDIANAEKKSIELEGYLQKFVDNELSPDA